MNTQGEKVLMAMSGGVDSSVAALRLLDEGYDVTGATMRLFSNDDACLVDASDPGAADDGSGKTCCSLKDAEDARQVCLTLGIEHFVYNFARNFNAQVIDRFCDAYLHGETPNPCIDCNRFLKFDALQQRRRDLGFDYVATGHYARRRFNEATGRYELLRAADANKDQSYVLYHLTQDTLAHMLFPLGDLTKPQVRELAQTHGFINAEKAESQDICFIPDGDYVDFIRRRRFGSASPCPIILNDAGQSRMNAASTDAAASAGAACAAGTATGAATGAMEGAATGTATGAMEGAATGVSSRAPAAGGAPGAVEGKTLASCTAFEPGRIVDRDGKVLGTHRGLIHYTIGQRKGIGVAAPEPLYVFAKDVARNELVVDTAARAVCRAIEVRDVNFIARASLAAPERFAVKTHYRQTPRPATVEQTGDARILITFDEPQRACAPGQSAVVYDGDVVVCGGTIERNL